MHKSVNYLKNNAKQMSFFFVSQQRFKSSLVVISSTKCPKMLYIALIIKAIYKGVILFSYRM